MPLTLEQYAEYLDTREDLPWPVAPDPEPIKAKPHLVRMSKIRVVLWNVYGTLVNILTGDVFFEHPKKFVMDKALDKTLQEFNMWGSMYRKPGQPSDYLGQMYRKILEDRKLAPSPGEKYPEVLAEVIWEELIKKLFQKEYTFDVSFFGSLNEYSQKVAYFFHASLQGTNCYPGAAEAMQHLKSANIRQGLLGNGQFFTRMQLQRGLNQQEETVRLGAILSESLCVLSHTIRGRKPSGNLFKHVLEILAEDGIEAEQILHVGNSIDRDIIPARKMGLRTALIAQDKQTLEATKEQLKDNASRPDVLLTELRQIAQIISPE